MKEEIKTIKVIIDSMQQEISFKLRTNNLCILTLRFPDGEEYEVISDDFFQVWLMSEINIQISFSYVKVLSSMFIHQE